MSGRQGSVPPVEGDLGVVDLATFLVRADEMLPAVLRPFHGTTEAQRGERDQASPRDRTP